ncbi:MAG: hypothetical protein AB7G15_12155 [Alphaproteobacteria bacterium]
MFLRNLSVALVGGAIGGGATTLFIWLLGALGVPAMLGMTAPPVEITKGFIYRTLVWGGIWGAVLMLPVLRRQWFWRGVLLSLLPTAALFFYFFPRQQLGMFGMNAGIGLPIMALVANFLWGIVAALWFYAAAQDNGRRFA